MSAARADAVEARLADAGVDALLVTEPVDLRYLTGFTGSNGLAVVGEELRRFATDFRYVEQAGDEVDGFAAEQGPRELLAALGEGWPAGGLRLGFDEATTTVRTRRRLGELVPAGIELVAVSGIVAGLRAVKDAVEVEAIAAAAALADAALAEVLAAGLAGRTEREVAFDLETRMRRAGAEPSFATIVASAEHGALPHAQPRDVPIPRDTLVTVDWGARLDGFCSDCTRTVATGAAVPEALLELHRLVLDAQLAALEAVLPGATGRAVDAVARDRIAAAGHGEHFGHSLGHGVGLEVHEAPRLSQTSDDVLEAGHVVTVEPGVYVAGLGGVRIEDLVVVGTDGPWILTTGHDKGPTVVG